MERRPLDGYLFFWAFVDVGVRELAPGCRLHAELHGTQRSCLPPTGKHVLAEVVDEH
jgi:hypothetical protein